MRRRSGSYLGNLVILVILTSAAMAATKGMIPYG